MVATIIRRNCSRLTTLPFLIRTPKHSVCGSAQFRQRELSNVDLHGCGTKLRSRIASSILLVGRGGPANAGACGDIDYSGAILFIAHPAVFFKKNLFFLIVRSPTYPININNLHTISCAKKRQRQCIPEFEVKGVDVLGDIALRVPFESDALHKSTHRCMDFCRSAYPGRAFYWSPTTPSRAPVFLYVTVTS